jgi:hypothetical protein
MYQAAIRREPEFNHSTQPPPPGQPGYHGGLIMAANGVNH